MGGFVLAWLAGEGIISYRAIKQNHAPPGPGQLLISSGVFVLLALLAESENARPIAVTLAWGFDIAAFINLFNITPGAGLLGGAEAVVNKAGPWPPGLAPNTVVIPTGNLTAETATPNAPSTPTPTGPSLQAPPPGVV
jgi:hypothetical protein